MYLIIDDMLENSHILDDLLLGEYVAGGSIYIDINLVKKRVKDFKIKDIIKSIKGSYEIVKEIPDDIKVEFERALKTRHLTEKAKEIQKQADPEFKDDRNLPRYILLINKFVNDIIYKLKLPKGTNILITPYKVMKHKDKVKVLVVHLLTDDISKFAIVRFDNEENVQDLVIDDDYKKHFLRNFLLN